MENEVNDSASDNLTDSGVNDSGPDVMENEVNDSASDNPDRLALRSQRLWP